MNILTQVFFIFCCTTFLSAQQIYTVTSLADPDPAQGLVPGTFRWAIESSNSSYDGVDTILFDPSFSSNDTVIVDHYYDVELMFIIDRPVVIYGGGVNIFANVTGNILQITEETLIENLRFINATSNTVGGALRCNTFRGPITLHGCDFMKNQSNAANNQGRGGAILQERGETIITNCHFEDNTGTLGIGGAISTEGFHVAGNPNFKITLINSTFVNNGMGAAVFIGCHSDLFLLDASINDAILAQGCENFELQSGSINLDTTFTVPMSVPMTIDLQSFD